MRVLSLVPASQVNTWSSRERLYQVPMSLLSSRMRGSVSHRLMRFATFRVKFSRGDRFLQLLLLQLAMVVAVASVEGVLFSLCPLRSRDLGLLLRWLAFVLVVVVTAAGQSSGRGCGASGRAKKMLASPHEVTARF